jgi:hypothetical protein
MSDQPPPGQPNVKLPLVGTQPRRRVIIGGAALVVVVVGVYLYRARAAATAGAVTVDPALGGTGETPYINPAPHTTISGTGGSGVDNPDLLMTDAMWGEKAVRQLSDGVHGSWDPMFVSIAVGKYLTDEDLTRDEETVIRAAIGQLGYPPHAHVIHLIQSGGSTPGGTPPGPNPPPPAPPAIPASLVAPARVNLYAWSQDVEAQYHIPYAVIERCKAAGNVWGGALGKDENGTIPYFNTPTTVTLG